MNDKTENISGDELRVMPHSIEAEEALLACLLVGGAEDTKAAMARALSARLKPEMFYRTSHQLIYAAMCKIFEAGLALDEIALLERLRADGHEDEVGGMAALFEIQKRVETSVSLSHFIKLTIAHWKQRGLIRHSREIMEASYTPGDSFDDVRKAIQTPLTEMGLLSVSEVEVTATQELETFIDNKRAELAGKMERVPHEHRVYLGLPSIEEKFGFIDRRSADNHIVIAAPSSTGKSTLMRQVVNVNLEKHADWNIAFFVLEGALNDYLHNSACAASGIPNDQPLDKWTSEECAKGSECAKKAKQRVDAYFAFLEFLQGQLDRRFFVLENDHGIDEIEARCMELEARLGRLDIVVVDYVQVVVSTLKGVNREQQMSEVSGRLKRLQKKLRCPLFDGSQLSEEGKARESRAIFNDATRFWKIDRPAKDANGNEQKDDRKQYLQTIEQEKFRNGRKTWASFNFNCEIGRFFDFAGIPAEKRGRPRKPRATQGDDF